jgi:hypothetical protein
MTHKSIVGTATTNEATENVYVTGIELIKNDSTSGDLLINLDGDTTTNYIVLKAGEAIESWGDYACNYIKYKSSTGSVSFRFLGTIKNRV